MSAESYSQNIFGKIPRKDDRLNQFQPKPYKLFNSIQHYDWGTRNEEAFIPKFLGIETKQDLPYAELWIGAHPKASSEIEIDGEKVKLIDAIEKYPDEILGKKVIAKFGKQLPFLLKILSAAEMLSVQLHPNKAQAKELNKKDPKNYPDANHKPEIAIAIDSLKAIAGFLPVFRIQENLVKYPELKELVGNKNYDSLINGTEESKLKEVIKNCYSTLMQEAANQNKIDSVLQKLVARFSSQEEKSEEEEQFLIQQKHFGNDIGLISFFFFNMIDLKLGEAIFTDAGIPHAYINGNIIECMANSDNVVRAGLTPKHKDVNALLEIIDYKFGECEVLNAHHSSENTIYKTSANEFEVSVYQQKVNTTLEIHSKQKPIIVLVMEGVIETNWNNNSVTEKITFKKGDSFMCPAILGKIILNSKVDSKYYIVSVPN